MPFPCCFSCSSHPMNPARPQLGDCFHTIQYTTIQHNTIQYNAIQCNAMQYNTMQCNAMQCNAMQCNAIWGFEDLGELGGFGDLGEPGPRLWGTRLEISNDGIKTQMLRGSRAPGEPGLRISRGKSPGLLEVLKNPL